MQQQMFLACSLKSVSDYFFQIVCCVSCLTFFLLPERKDKIEVGNRTIVQKFRSQLTEQLNVLHKTVSASVMQQENQLKEMEEDMQSFVSTKAEVLLCLRESCLVCLRKYFYGPCFSYYLCL